MGRAPVAFYGDTALIGARYGTNLAGIKTGVVYVFSRSGNEWTQSGKLIPENGEAGDSFGENVALYDTLYDKTAVIASPGHGEYGSAYIFTPKDVSNWSETDQMEINQDLIPDIEHKSRFGRSVGVFGDTVMVGTQNVDRTTKTDDTFVFVKKPTQRS